MIYERVCAYCKNAKITISAFEKLCGIGNGTIERWNKDGSRPSWGTLEKMEKATGIPIEEWIKKKESRANAGC